MTDPVWPEGWKTAPLWSMFERIKDVGHPAEEMLSVYRNYGVVKKDSRADNMNKTAENRDIYQLVDEGWLVVNRMKAWQGSVGISPFRGIVSGHYICFRPRHGEDSRFLNWLLRSPVYALEYARLSRGVRPNQIEIDNDELRVLPIRLPPLNEQRRIADFLDGETARVDQLIDVQQQLLDTLAERRQAGVLDLVSGLSSGAELKVSSALWAEQMPSHWQVVRLGLLARMGSGHTPSRSKPEWWEKTTIPWITTGEVAQVRDDRREVIELTREMISKIGLENSAAVLHPKGTVALCRTASAGYSAVMGTAMATSQDFATWTCGPRLDPFYLLWSLRAMRPDLLGRLAMGSTHKTIYVPDLQMLRILLPPLEEQKTIVRGIRAANRQLDSLTDSVRRQIELLAEWKRALVTAAVTGQLDVATAGRWTV